ncbi:hypothetical protein J2N86_13665 [Legionella lytica]|uniref:Ankyrin repeat protein n=1 Tax=Legionella lytica TaxID=96232 RepID=A0ABY4Y7U0_9GAMM|nr:hypothetical protein [Legionella lytica]USQ13704.1 hypothetical protein J2N86_13665 [Legionella lytica]
MSIVTLFEQMASTVHHKVNLNELLKEKNSDLQQIIENSDPSKLKALFNEKAILADRTTIFEL